ncbi:hypothetical protein DFH08DRAFT_861827 [Mycena albidolilacea]|uniref:BTB domain-containing protein n=1 Tax=Mycena albidolilacea TaxID=1033008 RepID=A0AAD7EU96_9AGAR|nr:hypothetical protein DFH08DRAFT_861827 [Mycena albidolilacea]
MSGPAPADDSPPAKRQRTEDEPITRSEIWYQDGSVVLQAQNIQFRVHWSILSQNSAFFSQLMGLPQPPDQPTMDNCPIVELQDDATDAEYLLKALYNLKFLYQPMLPLPVVSALIRLGRKYDFRDVLEAAVERITFENPATLKEYDARRNWEEKTTYTPTRIDPYRAFEFDILTLARENDIVSALPAAYYRALNRGLDSLLDGIPRDDGTLASLASIDLRRCIRGREQLMKAQTEPGNTWGWLESELWDYDECTGTSGQCDFVRHALFLDMKVKDPIKLRALNRCSEGYFKSMCNPCRLYVNELVAEGRKKMWEDLPSFFDLPPWSELKNDP